MKWKSPVRRITATATKARVTSMTSDSLRCLLGFSSFIGGAVLVLVTLEIVAVVLVPLDSVVDPREVAVVLTLEVTAY